MFKSIVKVVILLLAGAGALYLALAAAFFLSKDSCTIFPLMSIPSPSKALAVDIQNRSCAGEETVTMAWLRSGGSVASAGQVRLAELWTSPPLVDKDTGVVASPEIQVVWIDESTVKVIVPRNGKKAPKHGAFGVSVIYEER